jgi:hypothetical protein
MRICVRATSVGAHFGRQIQPKGGSTVVASSGNNMHIIFTLDTAFLGKAVSWGVLAHCVKSGTKTGRYSTPSQPKHECPLTM